MMISMTQPLEWSKPDRLHATATKWRYRLLLTAIRVGSLQPAAESFFSYERIIIAARKNLMKKEEMRNGQEKG